MIDAISTYDEGKDNNGIHEIPEVDKVFFTVNYNVKEFEENHKDECENEEWMLNDHFVSII